MRVEEREQKGKEAVHESDDGKLGQTGGNALPDKKLSPYVAARPRPSNGNVWPYVLSWGDPKPVLDARLESVWEYIARNPARLKKYKARVRDALNKRDDDLIAVIGVILGIKPQ